MLENMVLNKGNKAIEDMVISTKSAVLRKSNNSDELLIPILCFLPFLNLSQNRITTNTPNIK
jgi:hypothetical protein